jgi:hypothetical protein
MTGDRYTFNVILHYKDEDISLKHLHYYGNLPEALDELYEDFDKFQVEFVSTFFRPDIIPEMYSLQDELNDEFLKIIGEVK